MLGKLTFLGKLYPIMSLKTRKKNKQREKKSRCSAISSPLVQAVRLCKPPEGYCTVAPTYQQKNDGSHVVPILASWWFQPI